MALSRLALIGICFLGTFVAGCGEKEKERVVTESTDPAHALDLADVHLRHKKLDQARNAYMAAGKLSDEAAVQFRMEYGLSLVAEAQENLEAALPHLQKAAELAEEANRPVMRLKVADLLRRAGKLEESEESIDALLAKEGPLAIRGEVFRELILLFQGREEQLAAKIEALLAKNPEDRNLLAFLGDLYTEIMNLPKKAIEIHERHLKLEPQNRVLIDRLLTLSVKLEDLERGIRYAYLLQAVLEKEPRLRMGALMVLIDLQRKAKAYKEALAAVDKCWALAADDEKENLKKLFYVIHNEAGTLEGEIVRLEKEENLGDLWLVYAGVKGDFAKGLEVAKRMSAKDPKNLAALRMVVVAASQAGKDEETAQAGQKLLEADPGSANQVATPYAAVMKKLGKAEEAVRVLSAVSEKAPAVRPACYLAIAVLQPDQRPIWSVKAVEASRGDAVLCYSTGKALLELGSSVDALSAIDAGLALKPVSGTRVALTWERVRALNHLGRLPEAEAVCRSLIGDPDAGADVRQLAERSLLELLQKQGKSVKIGQD